MAAGHLSFTKGRSLIELETTYGTDAIDLANNLAVNRTYQDFRTVEVVPNTIPVEVQRVRGSGSPVAGDILLDSQSVTIEGALAGAVGVGGAGTEAPAFAALLKAAGLSETIVASTSATYQPTTTIDQSISMYHYKRDLEFYQFRLLVLTGLRGSLSMTFTLDDEATYTFEGIANNLPVDSTTADFKWISDSLAFFDSSGLIDLDKTGSAIVYTGSEAYADDPKLIVNNITVTVDGQDLCLSELTLNMNRVNTQVRAIKGATTTAKVLNLFDAPITLDMTLAESSDGYDKLLDLWINSSEVAATVTASLGTGNDRVRLEIPKLQVLAAPSMSDNGGTVAHSFTARLSGDYGSNIRGDNDFQLIWDAAP